MAHYCVPGCLSDSRKYIILSSHHFPTDIEVRKVWIQKTKRDPGPFYNLEYAKQ